MTKSRKKIRIQEYPLIERLLEETKLLYKNKALLGFIFVASALAELILREIIGIENGTYGYLISNAEVDPKKKINVDTHKQIKEIRNKYFHITARRINDFNGLVVVDKEDKATFISELDTRDGFEISISEDAQNIHKLLNRVIETF